MLLRCKPFLKVFFLLPPLIGCTQTQQIAIDYPTLDTDASSATQARQFQALPGFQA